MTEKKKKTLESISRTRNGDQTWKIKAERIIGKTTFLCTMLFAIWIHGEQVFAAEENGTRDTCLRCGVSQEAYLVTRCPRQIRHGRLLLRLCFSIPSYIRCIVLLRVTRQEMLVRFYPSISIHFPLAWMRKNSLLTLCYDEYYSINVKIDFFLFYINGKYIFSFVQYKNSAQVFFSIYFKKLRIRQLRSLQ